MNVKEMIEVLQKAEDPEAEVVSWDERNNGYYPVTVLGVRKARAYKHALDTQYLLNEKGAARVLALY